MRSLERPHSPRILIALCWLLYVVHLRVEEGPLSAVYVLTAVFSFIIFILETLNWWNYYEQSKRL